MLINEDQMRNDPNKEFLLTVVFPSSINDMREALDSSSNGYTFFHKTSIKLELDELEEQINMLTREIYKEEEMSLDNPSMHPAP